MSELGRGQIRVAYDIVSLLWVVVAFFEFVYLAGYVDIDLPLAVKGIIGVCLLIGGIALSLSPSLGVGVTLDLMLSGEEFVNWVIGVFVSFVTILLMNAVVNRYASIFQGPGLAFIPIAVEVFAMLVGVAEESSIRGYLLTALKNTTGSDALAILISSAIGSTLHAGIYGARNPTVILVVFLCFCVLGFTYAFTTEAIRDPYTGEVVRARRVSTVMTGHALVNLLAVLRRGV
jgi:membrane protease YdiL (CAAX protease family)